MPLDIQEWTMLTQSQFLQVLQSSHFCLLSLYTSFQFLEFSINGIIQYVLLIFVQLLSVTIIILRFIHAVTCIKSTFIFIAE